MKLRKTMAAMAAVAVMGVSMACAANIGYVNVEAIASATPSLAQGLKAVEAKYAPSLQTIQKAVDAQNTPAAKQAVLEKNKQTLVSFQKERANVLNPFLKKVNDATEKIRVDQKLDIVVDGQVVAAPKGSKVVDVTEQVYKAVK